MYTQFLITGWLIWWVAAAKQLLNLKKKKKNTHTHTHTSLSHVTIGFRKRTSEKKRQRQREKPTSVLFPQSLNIDPARAAHLQLKIGDQFESYSFCDFDWISEPWKKKIRASGCTEMPPEAAQLLWGKGWLGNCTEIALEIVGFDWSL